MPEENIVTKRGPRTGVEPVTFESSHRLPKEPMTLTTRPKRFPEAASLMLQF